MKIKATPLIIIGILVLSACQPTPTILPTENPTEPISTPVSPEVTEGIIEIPTDEGTEERAKTDAPFEPRIDLEKIADGLTAPVDLDAPDDGSGRLFVTDQVGLIRVIDSADNLLEIPFLDLRSRMVQLNERYDERGLLGLAFHPNFRDNGRFYVYYSAP